MLLSKIVIFFILFTASNSGDAKTVLAGAELISLTSNTRLREREFQGNMYVIDFWATWCESCRKNLAALETARRKQHSSTKFMFVSMDEEGPDIVRSFFELSDIKRSLTWIKPRAYWDKNQLLGKKLAKNGIPYLAAFNAKGKILFEHDGILQDSDIRNLNTILAKNEVR